MIYDEYIPYEEGTAVRKKEIYKETANKTSVQKKIKKVSKAAVKTHNKLVVYLFIISAFVMTILLTYRYNVISEKNLEVQNLKEELKDVESLLATTKIEVESNTDYNAIEAYAKQKLGMQKPAVSQIVYVDSSLENNLVDIKNENSTIETFFNSLKEKIMKLFCN